MRFKKLVNNSEFETYEQLLYSVFNKKNPDNWLCKNYIVKNNGYRSLYPYSSQKIFAIYNNENEMTGGIAVNLDNINTMQFEKVGFYLRKNEIRKEGFNYCEIINLVSKGNNLNTMLLLKNFLFRDLQSQYIDFALTTSSEKTLRFYLRYGCDILEEKCLSFGKKYLLKLDLSSKNDYKVISKYILRS